MAGINHPCGLQDWPADRGPVPVVLPKGVTLLFGIKMTSALERNFAGIQIEGDGVRADAFFVHPLTHVGGFEGVSQMRPPLAEGGVWRNGVDGDIFLAIGGQDQRRVVLHGQCAITFSARTLGRLRRRWGITLGSSERQRLGRIG